MKIFDVVNKDDNVIGQATREECHANLALIHHAVHLSLVDKKNKKVLLTQRSFKVKFDSGKICFPGEHVLSGKSYAEAVKRGVKEEFGVEPGFFVEGTQNFFQKIKIHIQKWPDFGWKMWIERNYCKAKNYCIGGRSRWESILSTRFFRFK